MTKIAITGTMGTGKSYVRKKLQQCGFFCLDCDEIAKEVRNQMQDEIYQSFGVQDKDALATLIFNDVTKRIQLEEMLYPKLIEKMLNDMQGHELVFVEVPLLYEKGWDVYFDEIWVVYASEKCAKERLLKKRNMNEVKVNKILKQQMTIEEKVKMADFVIYNEQADDVVKQIQERMQCDVEKE